MKAPLFAIVKFTGDRKMTLKVHCSRGGELFYRLSSSVTRVSYALSNLGIRKPLPDLLEETVDDTVREIRTALDSGNAREYTVKLVDVLRSHWDNHPDYPVSDWQREVAEGDTRLGYAEWVRAQMEGES